MCESSEIDRPVRYYPQTCVRRLTKLISEASRGFGFIRFPTLEDSKAFVERNYPMIYLYGNGSSDNDDQAAKVRIAYSRERDDRGRGEKAEGEWTCKIVSNTQARQAYDTTKTSSAHLSISQAAQNVTGVRHHRLVRHNAGGPKVMLMIIDMATFNQPAAKPQYLNSGDSDASPNGTPSQFLLIRNLEPTVTEDLLAKGVAKLYKPGRRSSPPAATASKKNNAKVASTTGDANLGAKEGSLRRILLVRDRRNNESWRYGFAEFATIEVIIQVLGTGCR